MIQQVDPPSNLLILVARGEQAQGDNSHKKWNSLLILSLTCCDDFVIKCELIKCINIFIL